MKTIEKDELYHTISEFMKSKGVELTDGPYAGHIRRGCELLSDVINVAQRTVVRAKEGMDKKLLQLRQCIHEATAPSQPAAPPPSTPPPSTPTTAPVVTPEPPDVQKTPGRRPKKSAKPRQAATTRRPPRRPKGGASGGNA